MRDHDNTVPSRTPLLRAWLYGPLTLEWIDPATGAELPPSDSSTGGRDWAASISLLALLLCQPNRQAHRDWIMEQFWPESSRSVTVHRLENIFSALRKLLRPPSGGESLLSSVSGKKNSGPSYCLAAYPLLWVDTDALLWNIEQAARMERFGDDALLLLRTYWQQHKTDEDALRVRFVCSKTVKTGAEQQREVYLVDN